MRKSRSFLPIFYPRVRQLSQTYMVFVWFHIPFSCSLSKVAFTPFTGAKLLEYQHESVKGMLSRPFHPFTKLFIGARVEEEFLKVEEALEMVEEEWIKGLHDFIFRLREFIFRHRILPCERVKRRF